MDASDTIGYRLKTLMRAQQLTEQAIADHIGVAQPTVNAWINGRASPRRNRMKLLAGMLGVSVAWLELGQIDVTQQMPALPPDAKRTERAERIGEDTEKVVSIIELDVRASAGDGALSEHEEHIATWQFPKNLLEFYIGTSSAIRIITVIGDSMVPDFLPGERVMVDTSDKRPSPPGTFILWDGLGLVVKKLEFIGDNNIPRVRIISKNSDYSIREEPLDSVFIQGRVVGKWLWT